MNGNPASAHKARLHPTTPAEISQFADQIGLEDTSQDSELEAPISIVEKPKSEFVRPTYSFKGTELFPFTYGYELLFNQVRDAEDTGLFTWLAFVYLLLKRSLQEQEQDHRKWAIRVCWKVEDFRLSLANWMDGFGPFSTEDKIEAKRIYEENMKAAAETSVEVVPDRKRTSQKKTQRQKKHSSSMSSVEN